MDSLARWTVPSPDRAAPAVWSGDRGDALRALGDLSRGREELADRGRDLGHRGRRLLRARRLLVGDRLQLGRRALHVPHRRAHLGRHRSRQQRPDSGHEKQAQDGAHQDGRPRGARGGLDLLGALLERGPAPRRPWRRGARVSRPCSSCPRCSRRSSASPRSPSERRVSMVRCSSANFDAMSGSSCAMRRVWFGLSAVSCFSSSTMSGDPAGARAIRLEVGVVARDDEAALAGLGVLQLAEDAGDALEDGVRVRHRVARLRQGIDAPVRDDADEREQRERHREARRNLPSERPHG